jgi:uncharacterized protein (DUF1800 family)
MPIVSTKGLTAYTGSFTDREKKHLLRRTCIGVTRQRIASLSGQSLTQLLSSVLTLSAEPSPPLNHYDNLINPPTNKEASIPYGATWVNTQPTQPMINFLKVRSFKSWLIQNYLKDTTITEKMALFLHSFIPITHDVNDPRFLYFNYKMLRANSLGNFKTIIKNTLLDPGMLNYLNGDKNQKNSPDENLGRELQELFTLGKGYTPIYSEDDVKAAARVLTGYQINYATAAYTFNSTRHDTTNKQFSSFFNNTVITGKTGAAGEQEIDDLLNMIFAKNEVALHFCRKLYGFFIYYDIDATVEANIIVPLANIMRTNNYEILPVLQAFFASEHFFDADTYGSHIKSPIDYMVGYFKELEIAMPDATNLETQYEVYAEPLTFAALLRQEPYDPPNVAGWDAYYQSPLLHENWITTDTIANRNKLAVYLLVGYTKRTFKLQVDLVGFTKGFSNPADVNILIDDALVYLHTIPSTPELKAKLKTILLYNQNSDTYWTGWWNDHLNAPTDVAKKKIVTDLLTLFYKYIIELAEYQLM